MYEGKEWNRIKAYLDQIEASSIDQYYRMCYTALITSTEDILSHDADVSLKAKGISKLMDYFVEREEFEKCVELDKLLKLLPKYE